MFHAYVLRSLKTGRYYIGETEDIDKRLLLHNSGRVFSTRQGIPWKIVYLEECKDRSEARILERKIKSYKGGIQFKALLDGTIRKR